MPSSTQSWPHMLAHVTRFAPQFLILQCGADSIAGDPITHLRLSSACHARAARELCALADRLEHGRVLALGGGGYDRGNLARAWSAVVRGAARGLTDYPISRPAAACGRSRGRSGTIRSAFCVAQIAIRPNNPLHG